MFDDVSTTYVIRFNEAAGFAHDGEIERALEAYEHVFAPLPLGEPELACDRFRATVAMRRAWLLMDLGRYEEARAALLGPLAPLRSSMPPLVLHEYYFALGHTLARLRDPGLRQAFEHAIAIAEQLLHDRSLAERAWEGLLAGLERLEDWTELDWNAHVCGRDGIRFGSARMQAIAGEYAAKA